MAGENEVIEEQQTTAEQDEQAVQDAFSASFETNVRVDEAPAEVKTEEVADETANVADEEVDTNVDADTSPEEKVGVTAEQLTEMLAKLPKIDEIGTATSAEVRKLHGKIGEINRALLDLQKNGQGNKSGVKLTGEHLKRLHAEYPDLANLIAEDLNEAGSAVGNTAPQNENFDERVAQVKEDLTKEMQTNLLRVQHRDFTTVIQSNDFKVWSQTLPAQDQKELNDSWDAMYLGEKLTEFKNWHAAKQTGTNERKERLARAITPKGTQAALKPQPLTEQDGFNAAFAKK
jgi:hypothetical protein